MANGAVEKLSASETKKEDWMNAKWRPMMGWMYMAVCSADFMLFPVLWSLLQSTSQGSVQTQWQPLTLQGAGLFHIAMGAVLGIAAYGRTQEKLGGANNGGIQMPNNAGTTYVPPGQGNVSVSNQAPGGGFGHGNSTTGYQGWPSTFSQPQSGGFGSPGGFNSPAPAGFGSNSGFGAPVSPAGGFGAMPVVSRPAPSRPPLDEKFPPLD